MTNQVRAVMFVFVALLAIVVAIGLALGVFGNRFSSNGERIYFTATNERGVRITYRGYPAFGNPGMMMNTQFSCASCHGVDARGGVHTMHMQVMDAPDIRWPALAGEIGEGAEGGEDHGEEHSHTGGSYDLEAFRMAVVEGKHPSGEALSDDMPRWNIGDDDLGDLAAFLKSPIEQKKGEYEMFPGSFMMGGWWIIFPIIGIIVMALCMFLIFGRGGFRMPWDGTGSTNHYGEGREPETALDILKKRYARGEISKEDYEQMREELR